MKLKATLAVLMVAALGAVTPALAITIVSVPGINWTSDNDVVCGGPGSCDGLTQDVTPHALWKDETATNPLAQWISYAPTGVGPDSTLAPINGSATNPVGTAVIWSVLLNLPAGGGGLNFNIWADDTAELFIDNVSVYAPNFSQDICADGSIGCEEFEFYNHVAALGPGVHTIRMDFFQVGEGDTNDSNPHGALWSGTYDVVPEPASMILLGTGLLGLGASARRRRAKAKNVKN